MAEVVHTLKTQAPYFDAIARGEKTYEVRRDDRGFQRGDLVKLERYDGRFPSLSRLSLTFRIGFVLTGGQFGLEPGHVAFSLLPVLSNIDSLGEVGNG